MSNQNDQSTQLGGTPAWGTRRGPVVPYVPALDGLRALAPGWLASMDARAAQGRRAPC